MSKDRHKDIVEGLKFGFATIDFGLFAALGVPSGLWSLDDKEAEVLARVLEKRAANGDAKAVQALAVILERTDEIQAAMILVPRVYNTVKGVAKNGIKPGIVGSPKKRDSLGERKNAPGSLGENKPDNQSGFNVSAYPPTTPPQ